MSVIAFWAAAAIVAFTYAGMPALVLLRGLVRNRPPRSGEITPSVSVVIAARNEEASAADKIANLQALDYPDDLLEIVIASDGSEDGTVAAARSSAGSGVTVLDLPRVGKAGALNQAVAASRGEILVFTDANSLLATDAVSAITRPFADPDVGGVAGDQRYLPAGDGRGIAHGERGYWSADRLLKVAESRAGNVISATGALYAVRRTLFRPVPDGVTDDFITSTAVIAQGKRLVFCPEAVVYEPVATSGEEEYVRKVRVMTRGLRGVALRRELLDPRRTGFYALQLLWHKVLRRLMALPLLVAGVTSLRLFRRGPVYQLTVMGQAVVYGCGAAGLLLRDRPSGRRPLLAIPAYFCLVNAASIHAAWNLLLGRRIDRWEPARSRLAAATPSAATRVAR